MSVFQFSIELTGNQNILKAWLDHFEEVGTPAGIVEHDGYASVWRAGTRAGSGEKTDRPIGTLKMFCNGFEVEWEMAGGVVAAEDTRSVGWERKE